jgi:hypothetical protein
MAGTSRKRKTKEDTEDEVIHPSRRQRRSSSPVGEDVPIRRSKRSGAKKPMCTGYGKNRRQLYPNHFFCSECDLYESEFPLNKRIKRTSLMYGCTANHKCWIFPTDVCAVISQSKKEAQNKQQSTPTNCHPTIAYQMESPVEKAIRKQNTLETESLKKDLLSATQKIQVQSRLIDKLRHDKSRQKKRNETTTAPVLEEDEQSAEESVSQKQKIRSFLSTFFDNV